MEPLSMLKENLGGDWTFFFFFKYFHKYNKRFENTALLYGSVPSPTPPYPHKWQG